MKYILDNQIAIGEKIPNEFELAGIFDVGRSTIREAVKAGKPWDSGSAAWRRNLCDQYSLYGE